MVVRQARDMEVWGLNPGPGSDFPLEFKYIFISDGRSTPTFRKSFAAQLRALAEINGINADDMKKLADDRKEIIDMIIKISDLLKEDKKEWDHSEDYMLNSLLHYNTYTM